MSVMKERCALTDVGRKGTSYSRLDLGESGNGSRSMTQPTDVTYPSTSPRHDSIRRSPLQSLDRPADQPKEKQSKRSQCVLDD
jgi:hypothetical protein